MDGKKAFPLSLLAILFLAACAMGAEPQFVSGVADEAFFEEAAAESTPMEPGASNVDRDVAQKSLQVGEAQERLIIRTGNVDIIVEDTEESLSEITRLAVALDGWVVSSDVFQSNGAKSGNVTVRVPAERYDEAMRDIKELAIEVRSESSSAQDVTEEFVDLSARLANLEATADRVHSFLDEARTVEEALEVNRELSRLEGEIESIKGRMQYLSQSAAFSTLSVHLTPDELSQPIEIGGWRPEGVAKNALESLISALQSIANVLIWIGIFCLPLVIIFGIPAFFIIRYAYRRRRRRQEIAPTETAESGEQEDEAAGELE